MTVTSKEHISRAATMNTRYFAGFFATESDLRNAAAAAKAGGLQIDEVYSPYPLHDIETLVGYRPSRMAWVGFIAGFIGLIAAGYFEYWTSMMNWPVIIGGKPMNSWPAFVPVAFEATVLVAGVCTFAALILRTRLWSRKHQPVIPEANDNLFVLVLRESDASFDMTAAQDLCALHGVREIREGVAIDDNAHVRQQDLSHQTQQWER